MKKTKYCFDNNCPDDVFMEKTDENGETRYYYWSYKDDCWKEDEDGIMEAWEMFNFGKMHTMMSETKCIDHIRSYYPKGYDFYK